MNNKIGKLRYFRWSKIEMEMSCSQWFFGWKHLLADDFLHFRTISTIKEIRNNFGERSAV